MGPDLIYCNDAYEAATGANAVVIVTKWEAFRALDSARLKGVMAAPVLVDLRNVYRRDEVERQGSATPPSEGRAHRSFPERRIKDLDRTISCSRLRPRPGSIDVSATI